jgi:Amidase
MIACATPGGTHENTTGGVETEIPADCDIDELRTQITDGVCQAIDQLSSTIIERPARLGRSAETPSVAFFSLRPSRFRLFGPSLVGAAWLVLLAGSGYGSDSGGASDAFQVRETTIPRVEAALRAGELTCRQLVRSYLAEIASRDQTGPAVNSFLELNPDALTIAKRLDQAFQASGPVGPLHCVPMVLKDNYGTANRNHTTAGSLTMLGFGEIGCSRQTIFPLTPPSGGRWDQPRPSLRG